MLHLNTENKFNQLWTNQLQACWSKKQELLIMCLSHTTFCCLFNGRNLRKMDLFSRNGQSNSRVYWLWWFIYFPVLLVDLFVKYYWVSFSQLTCWSHCFSSAGILLLSPPVTICSHKCNTSDLMFHMQSQKGDFLLLLLEQLDSRRNWS